jgi:hypothetical protein
MNRGTLKKGTASSPEIRPKFPEQIPTAEGTGTVNVVSDPDGAEIFVDDKFYGDAPATLRLPVGTHSILLKWPHRLATNSRSAERK